MIYRRFLNIALACVALAAGAAQGSDQAVLGAYEAFRAALAAPAAAPAGEAPA